MISSCKTGGPELSRLRRCVENNFAAHFDDSGVVALEACRLLEIVQRSRTIGRVLLTAGRP